MSNMSNAKIYFAAAKMAMANQPNVVNCQKEAFKNYLADNMVELMSYTQQIDIVLLNVRHQVQSMAELDPSASWALNDYDSISWFLGIFAKGLSEYLKETISFERIFQDSFNKHFRPYGMD